MPLLFAAFLLVVLFCLVAKDSSRLWGSVVVDLIAHNRWHRSLEFRPTPKVEHAMVNRTEFPPHGIHVLDIPMHRTHVALDVRQHIVAVVIPTRLVLLALGLRLGYRLGFHLLHLLDQITLVGIGQTN